MKKSILIGALLAVCATAWAQNDPWRDENLPIETRVEDLLGRLTLDEKIDLLRATSPGVPRLGIDKYYHGNEALHGIVRPGKFTVFPQAIGLASMWNPDLLETIAGVISDEARARWNELERGKKQTAQFSDLLTFWSPTVNMARDPRWGRTPETYGEDPFLSGETGAAFVRGLQGKDPRYLKVVSTPKHFSANNEEHNRFECNAVISEKQMREYYLPPFEACIRRGKAQSIMSAYNAINGIPCTANPWLLTTVLRDEWGFDGYVVSDCGAVGNIVEDHHYVLRDETAAALALQAGLDLECGDNIYIEPLHRAYELHLVGDADIDRAARRVLTARMRLGIYDDPAHNPYNALDPAIVGSEKHRALALQAAREAIVLLKNDKNLLPLKAGRVKSIAVVGLNADKCEFGDYSGEPVTAPVSVLDGIKAMAGKSARITHVPWDAPVDDALAAARSSQIVVAVMGINKDIEREGKDRNDLNLPADQQEYIQKLYRANPNLVLVLVAGSPLSIIWEDKTVPAIVNAWYPGQEGGTAVAEVLFGKYNPAGRVPVTYYYGTDDLPAFDDYDITKRTYKYFDGDVLYPFGYGLSYTTFRYSNLQVADRGDTVDVTFDLKNTGRYDGDEVAQVYVRLPEYEGKAPISELRGFRRVHLKRGETKTVTIPLRREDLRYWSESRRTFVIPQGLPEIQVGASSRDIRLERPLSPYAWGDTEDGYYRNPVLLADYSDPDAIRFGDRYYMVASDFHFMGMQVLESADLVNWKIVSQIYSRLDFPGWDTNEHYSGGSWAPSIRWHDGLFYVYFCTPDEGLFMSTASTPAGPWAPLHCVKSVYHWEDPCPFWDEDGQAYLGHSLHGAGPIIIHKMSPDGRQLLDDGVTVYRGPVAEGTKIHKWNGYYYMSIPEGGVGGGWQTVLRSKDIYGPYERRIVLETGTTSINGPHQGAIVDTPDGEWWFLHFQERDPLGRVVHLQPMHWEDGWPVMGEDYDGNGIGEPVPRWRKPVSARAGKRELPTSSDSFQGPGLGLQWQFNHNPQDDGWSLTRRKGRLALDGLQADSFRAARNTLSQKLMGYQGSYTVRVDLTDLADGQLAGLACMGRNNYCIGIRQVSDRRELYFEKDGEVLGSQALKTAVVWLRLSYDAEVREGGFSFLYSLDGKRFEPFGEAFAAHNGFWKGARPALYSYNTEQRGGTAWFRDFVFTEKK